MRETGKLLLNLCKFSKFFSGLHVLLPAINALLFISYVRRGAACLSVDVFMAAIALFPYTSSPPYLPPLRVIPVLLWSWRKDLSKLISAERPGGP